jgi:hypothetical protein
MRIFPVGLSKFAYVFKIICLFGIEVCWGCSRHGCVALPQQVCFLDPTKRREGALSLLCLNLGNKDQSLAMRSLFEILGKVAAAIKDMTLWGLPLPAAFAGGASSETLKFDDIPKNQL